MERENTMGKARTASKKKGRKRAKVARHLKGVTVGSSRGVKSSGLASPAPDHPAVKHILDDDLGLEPGLGSKRG